MKGGEYTWSLVVFLFCWGREAHEHWEQLRVSYLAQQL